MKTSNKTPYEIRLELLQLAFEILSYKHNVTNINIADDALHTFPTTEDVIAEAEKMNSFISKVGTH